MNSLREYVAGKILTYPDFPKAGIMFRDIMPLFYSGDYNIVVDYFMLCLAHLPRPTKIAAIESRGFLLGMPLAHQLGCGFVPIRKPGKLPGRVSTVTYELEYGNGALQIQDEAVRNGDMVVLVDDVLATGGTLSAAYDLLRDCGAVCTDACVLLEIGALGGRAKLNALNVNTFIKD